MGEDGAVIIRADLDDKKAQAELNRLARKIDNINDQIEGKNRKRSYLAAQADAIQDAYKAAIYGNHDELAQRMAKEYDKVQAAIARIDNQLQDHNIKLDIANEKAGKYAAQLAGAGDNAAESLGEVEEKTEEAAQNTEQLNTDLQEAGESGQQAGNQISEAMERASGKINKIGKRIIGMVRRVFIFSLITKALRGVRSWFSDILTSSDEAKEALGRLKGALLTLAQPLIEVIIPAFVDFVNILTKVVNAISSIVSKLFGTTIEQSAEAAENLYDEQQALKGVGSAAKKASKQLAAFDQLNVLSENASGGGSNSEIKPIFGQNGEDKQGEGYLNKILGLVKAIGAAFLAWKIGTGLGLGLKEILGIALLLYSTFEFIGDFLRTWDEGLTWDNLKQLLLDILGMAAGAYLAFGKIGAGIALVLGGLALLAVAFHDMNENGMTLENTLAAIAGLFMAGLGLSILTGSFIPLALAALGSLLLALVYLFGEGEEFTEGMRKIFDGLGKFFKGIFAGDIESAVEGLKLAWEGLKQVGMAVARALQKAWQAFLDWIGQKLGQQWKAFFERLGQYFNNWINTLKLGFSGIVKFIKGVFTGDWQLAWEGVKDVLKAVFNSMLNFAGMLVNGFVDGINLLINGLNSIVGDIPDWVELFGLVIPGLPTALVSLKKANTIGYWNVPQLAQGAVIPPNREFMAVLGDQKHGTNIEAPLETIVAAFKQAVGDMRGQGQEIQVKVYLDSREIKSGQQRLNRVMGV